MKRRTRIWRTPTAEAKVVISDKRTICTSADNPGFVLVPKSHKTLVKK